MSKLSHIDEIEQRNLAAEEARTSAPEAESSSVVTDEPAPSTPEHELPAEEDEEFHGLDSTKPMGAMHKTLIVLAVAVVVVAILYVVNSWIHFI